MTEADLIIIGAGPAGMSAAATAARGGARVLILDEQPRPGGQIYRDVGVAAKHRPWLGPDYAAGAALLEALDHDGIRIETGVTVWRVEAGPRVVWSRDGVSRFVQAPQLLIATGAQERPVPFPGWSLPGVMPAGAAQVLMKSAGLLPRGAVLAGSGPLLYLVAVQLIDAGAPPRALVETQRRTDLLRAARHLPRGLRDAATLWKGLGLLRRIAAAGIPRHPAASGFRAETASDGGIVFSFTSQGRTRRIETPLLLTHQGVVPSTHMSRSAGVEHVWDPAQKAVRPVVDGWGAAGVPGVHIAGDGAGIAGAEAARVAGRVAAFDILHRLGRIDAPARDRAAAADRRTLARARALRPFLDAAYAPAPEFLAPEGDTIVCRCEEITAAALRAAARDGAAGPRRIKTATRAGMGPCQGRMCELTVRGILTACGHRPAAPRARSPIKPVKLGEIAALDLSRESGQ
ncbi:FAD-dependent oxidoreductase [Limimaricola cinnabarinus]|uniref:FAD-dependent oxidoreductase n=1 Tax=Limimaricola cinnabarinus TaxID=1125964 RepID=UPI002FE008A7